MISKTLADEKLKVASVRGAKLLIDNGLGDWTFSINRKRSVLAETWHKEKKIVFSKYFLLVATPEQVDGVTLHEATHALLGPGYGHGKEFVELCEKISPNSYYAKEKGDVSIRRYVFTCPECKYQGSHNSPAVKGCGKCYKEGKVVKLDMEKNQIKVLQW